MVHSKILQLFKFQYHSFPFLELDISSVKI
jgi:hypothetical protein